jgi:hypothetical protein
MKYVNGSVNSEGHLKKIKNQVRRLFRPISIYLPVCHQKPNPARETVPLKSFFAGEAGGQGACAGEICGDPAGLREAQRYQEPASTRQQDQRENARGHTTEENRAVILFYLFMISGEEKFSFL